jgi:hypothetical protein
MDPSTIYSKEGFVAFCLVAVGLFVAWLVRTLTTGHMRTIEKVGANIEANTGTLLSIAQSSQRVETKIDEHGDKLDEHGRRLAQHGEHIQDLRRAWEAKHT